MTEGDMSVFLCGMNGNQGRCRWRYMVDILDHFMMGMVDLETRDFWDMEQSFMASVSKAM
jgi:hypothetical protein